MFGLQKYKNILGEPGTGIHKYRFMETAIVDYILAIILAIAITYITKIPLVITTILSLLLGIATHLLFEVETNTTKLMFKDIE